MPCRIRNSLAGSAETDLFEQTGDSHYWFSSGKKKANKEDMIHLAIKQNVKMNEPPEAGKQRQRKNK